MPGCKDSALQGPAELTALRGSVPRTEPTPYTAPVNKRYMFLKLLRGSQL